jgi:ribonucleoside-diphosphate reductase beta chain
MESLVDNVNKDLRYVIKRNGDKVLFESEKIEMAVLKAMNSVGTVDDEMAEKIARISTKAIFRNNKDHVPHVDEIHDMVENKLMDNGLNDVAKEYIIYRAKNRPNIFSKRVNLKPFEYPNLNEYVDAIRHSYWVHTEFNFTSDIQDFKVHLNEKERSAVERAMLAISQIEVAVKTFWGDIYKRMPKPEIGNVGATFAESEVRHADAYSHLIQLLGLNKEFENLLEVPSIRRRIKYLEKSITNSKAVENRDYFESVVLFSMFVENVSLFSQFLVIMSFNKHKNMLKGISNAVEATSKEENIHAEFGFDLVNTIKSENPNWWTDQLVEDLVSATMEAYEAEKEIVDWIFEKGDLDFLTKSQTMEFIKHRFNISLNSIGIDSIFDVNETILETTEWFDDEILTTKHTDFFNKRSINYSKKTKSITSNDLF